MYHVPAARVIANLPAPNVAMRKELSKLLLHRVECYVHLRDKHMIGAKVFIEPTLLLLLYYHHDHHYCCCYYYYHYYHYYYYYY